MNNTVPLNPEVSKKGLRRNIFAGAIGVLVHWFDWAVYAYLATTISHVFSPSKTKPLRCCLFLRSLPSRSSFAPSAP